MTLLVLIAFSSISQTSSVSDSGLVCIPTYQARVAIKTIDSFKIMKQELFLVKMQYSVLNERFSLKKIVIGEMEEKAAVQKRKEANLDMQVFNITGQRELGKIEIAGLKRDVKREKGKVKIIGGVFIAFLGVLVYSLVK